MTEEKSRIDLAAAGSTGELDWQMADTHTLLVSLNRPQARNAITVELADALNEIVSLADESPAVRAVVITGKGGNFCSGADLRQVAAGQAQAMIHRKGGFAGMIDAIRSKPWIAAVDGYALAGGFEIALACDLIVASEDARFGLPEPRHGMVASGGGAFRLARRIPQAVATELVLTGRMLEARPAEMLGLVNAVVPSAKLLETALELAAEIGRNSPLAVRESLGLVRQAHDLHDSALLKLSNEAHARVERSPDFLEGPRSFLEKRAPRWTT